jgi:VIT1/CCC1 family predicted Fe2+/Mn2+ transporter
VTGCSGPRNTARASAKPRTLHRERHRTEHIGWLRAAVLGANDGIVSVASLLVGMAASGTARQDLLLAGTAGLVAGAMSMAAGEYVSVSSQADTEAADLTRERAELLAQPELERQELAAIYVARGVSPELAARVAEQLMRHDALGSHARDELGVSATMTARPLQAALTSAVSFVAGAVLPLLAAILVPRSLAVATIALSSLVFLTGLGGFSAQIGGAPVRKAALRVFLFGALALGITAGVGRLVGAVL